MRIWFLVIGTLGWFTNAVGMVDNRFLDPALGRPLPLTTSSSDSYFQVQPFVLSAKRSISQYGQEVPLFDYSQNYQLRAVDNASVEGGWIPESLIRTDWRGPLSVGPYHINGRMDGSGFAASGYVPFGRHAALGLRTEWLHVRSCSEPLRDSATFEPILEGPGDEYELHQIQAEIHEALGLEPGFWDGYGFGDTELYLRIFHADDYAYRCRYIDAGVAVGFVLPTAHARDFDNPVSIPFGGADGIRTAGIFVEANVDAILKYDLRAGLMARYQQRFSHTAVIRAPVATEPIRYGGVVGLTHIRPGPTLVLQPRLLVENIREGLGIHASYMLVAHMHDSFGDARENRSVPRNLFALCEDSRWATEHVTCGIFYDFRDQMCWVPGAPVLTLAVDVPVDWVAAKRSFKTYGVSVSLDAYF